MRTPVEIFDDACRTWGFNQATRFFPIPDALSGLFEGRRTLAQSQIAILSGLFRAGHKINIYVDFVDSGELNAVADVRELWGLVGLLRGTVLLPLDMFSRMLAHPKVLPDIGDPSKESMHAQHTEGLVPDFDQLTASRRSAGQSPEPLSPVDPLRSRFASLAAEIAYDFLVLHELSHIMYGHCEYLQAKNGIPFILEVAHRSPTDAQDNRLRQAIEFHADKCSAHIGLSSMLSFSNEVPSAFAPIYSTPEQRLFLWCFAISGVFRLWGLRIDPSELDAEGYPPTALRFDMAMRVAHGMLRDKHPKLAAGFKTICHDAQDELDSAVVQIGGNRLAREDVIHLNDARTDSHVRAVFRYANRTLVPALEKYSYLQFPKVEQQ